MLDQKWLSVVGVGEEGLAAVGPVGRSLIDQATLLVGGSRHLAMLPNNDKRPQIVWTSPLETTIEVILQHRGQPVCVLASGDPFCYGIGTTLARTIPFAEMTVVPAPSAFSLACARLGWSLPDVETLSLCGRDPALLRAVLYAGAKILVLSADRKTPAIAAQILTAQGFGDSLLTVLERMGNPNERILHSTAADWTVEQEMADLNTVAIECRGARSQGARSQGARSQGARSQGARSQGAREADLPIPEPPHPEPPHPEPPHPEPPHPKPPTPPAPSPPRPLAPRLPGLPDTAYHHDGQLTKREIRAVTLAALAPLPGELLWDVGAGCGSIGIEWMRSDRRCRAIAIESHPDRLHTIAENATALGTPNLQIKAGKAPDALHDLPQPDAIFVGGGLTTPQVWQVCWAKLRPGGRLVANAVTVETEQLVFQLQQQWGGELSRIAIQRAEPVGKFLGWKAMAPVTQWIVVKSDDG